MREAMFIGWIALIALLFVLFVQASSDEIYIEDAGSARLSVEAKGTHGTLVAVSNESTAMFAYSQIALSDATRVQVHGKVNPYRIGEVVHEARLASPRPNADIRFFCLSGMCYAVADN